MDGWRKFASRETKPDWSLLIMNATLDDVGVVSSVAESIKNDSLQSFPEAASVGDAIRQGDVYVTLLAGVPSGCTIVNKPSKQLAPGNTQGSRHCIKSFRGVKVYSLPSPTMYDGPVIECKSPVTITHPEHGDWLLPTGVYGVSYQRTEDSEGRQQRVQD